MGELIEKVVAAKRDERLLGELVERDKQWILRCASKTAKRYVTDSDDEWSAALSAYAEAIGDYAPDKGDFHTFASVVIRRRVVDLLRSEARHDAEIAVSPDAFEGGRAHEEAGALEARVQQQVARNSAAASQDAVREEIAAVQSILREYGFSFFDLAQSSPKAEKTKKSCAQAVRSLLASAALLTEMRLKRLLPILELSRVSGVIRKILERHRRYIIAAAEILDGDFPILAPYLDYIRKG